MQEVKSKIIPFTVIMIKQSGVTLHNIPANFFSVKCARFYISTKPEFPKIYHDAQRFPMTSEDCRRCPDDFRI